MRKLRDLFKGSEPEEGDDLDGCALDFSHETEEAIPLEPDPAPPDLGVPEPGAKPKIGDDDAA